MAPKSWSGYIRILVGFLILTVLLSPVFRLKNVEIFETTSNISIREDAFLEKIKKELEARVEEDICKRIETEFNEKAECLVKIDADNEGRIRSVKSIVLKMKKIPQGVKERLVEVYGCENIELELK